MTTIVTRAGKGSALTHTEVDANFTNLNNDKLELVGGNLGIGTASPISGAGLTIGNDGNASAIVKLAFSTTASDRASVQLNGATGEMRLTAGFAGYGGLLTIHANGSERMRLDSSGNLGIGTASPTAKLDVSADTLRLRTARTPASATAAGNAGDICWDSAYLYICTATNTWRRIAHATW